MNDATRGLWRYFSAVPLICPDKFPMVTTSLDDAPKRGPSPLWGVVAILEIARHAQDRNPVSMKQKIAERKRIKIVIRRHFRKRIIPKN